MSNSSTDSRCPTARELLPRIAAGTDSTAPIVDGTTSGQLAVSSLPSWNEGDCRTVTATVSPEQIALFADLSGLAEAVTLDGPLTRFVAVVDIETFAAISGDDQPLHLDDDFARHTPFGKRIAHGMLSASYIAAALKPYLDGGRFLYRGQTLDFVAPVFPGDRITVLRSIVRDERRDGGPLVLSTICQNQEGKTVLSGEATIVAADGHSDTAALAAPHMLPVSFVSAVLGKEIPGQGAIYRKQSLQFVEAVHAGDTITTSATLNTYDRSKGRMVLSTVSTNQHGAPVLTGEAVIVYKPEMFVASAPMH